MRLLLLLRHAVTEHTGARLSGWMPGLHLSEQGREQAGALAGRLEPVPLDALRASLEGVQRVGAAALGDKTMVDALSPALGAFELELRLGGSLETATCGAREAATEGMRATIPLQARKGRASYLGPRSVGHQDPGATSTALMFAALEQAVLADRSQRFAGGARRRGSGR